MGRFKDYEYIVESGKAESKTTEDKRKKKERER